MRKLSKWPKGGDHSDHQPHPPRPISVFFLAFSVSLGPPLGFSTNTKQGPQRGNQQQAETTELEPRKTPWARQTIETWGVARYGAILYYRPKSATAAARRVFSALVNFCKWMGSIPGYVSESAVGSGRHNSGDPLMRQYIKQ